MKSLIVMILSLFCVNPAWGLASTRAQVVQDFKNLKEKNTKRLQEHDERIQALMAPKSLSASLSESEIERINESRQDLLQKQQLLDRLLFQVDTRFHSGDLREFLSERLAEMARIELLNNSGQQNLWKQMTYLSQALRDLPERGDNIVSFVDGYLSRSSFRQPIKPEEYLRTRQYTNGRETVSAAPSNQENIGEVLEQRLEALEQNP